LPVQGVYGKILLGSMQTRCASTCMWPVVPTPPPLPTIGSQQQQQEQRLQQQEPGSCEDLVAAGTKRRRGTNGASGRKSQQAKKPEQPSVPVPKAAFTSALKRGLQSGSTVDAGGQAAQIRKPDVAFCASPRVELRCYGVLGILRSATALEVRHAYRRRCLEVHPDKGGEGAAFLSVAEAFETLSQSASREAYDKELVLFGSSDGLGGTSGTGATPAPSEMHDLATWVHILCEMSPAEWPSYIANLTSSSLKFMDGLISNPKSLAGGPNTTQGGVDAPEGKHSTQVTCLQWSKGHKAWFVRSRIRSLLVQSRYTKCRSTASQWHISVVTLKELFKAHRKQHADMSVEEAWVAAFAEARLQKIYFSAVYFRFSIEFQLPTVPGKRARCIWTPEVHSLDLALEHRMQFLGARGMGLQTITELKRQLKESSKAKRAEWQAHMEEKQKLLQGYILCELHNRSRAQTRGRKRFRLNGKQPVAQSYESTPALTWLTGMLVDETTSNDTVQDRLRSFLSSDEVTSLRQFLHDAVQRHSVLP